ncbi:MAG: ABC transporter ATP-binding protein [Clostridium cadaveris]|uniref:ABC transporter ATP-binding protein n=1 Tax=Clostridium cadaveris TaxID=1529 RepID=UPI002A874CE6|nr:ABC transporter ATP-binding protein [Clostridium cadaveris]
MKIVLKNLYKKFDEITAVNDVNVIVENGEFISILGPSGCGKSTLLFMISGLIEESGGEIFFDNLNVKDIPTEERGIGMVFQNYSLYPHMTVKENILFPLKVKKMKKKDKEEALKPIVSLLKLENLLNRKPNQLSGGQQQRVAIGRALIKKPSILLMDEPFSNLDEKLRVEMREEIKAIQRKVGITTLFVTHDQEEAMSISDKILLMKDGQVMQYCNGEELYRKPESIFAASFIGRPKINLVKGKIINNVFQGEGLKFNVPSIENMDDVEIGIRPENIVPDKNGNINGQLIEEKVLGKDVISVIDCSERRLSLVYGNHIHCMDGDGKFKVKSFHIYKDNKLIGDVFYEDEE